VRTYIVLFLWVLDTIHMLALPMQHNEIKYDHTLPACNYSLSIIILANLQIQPGVGKLPSHSQLQHCFVEKPINLAVQSESLPAFDPNNAILTRTAGTQARGSAIALDNSKTRKRKRKNKNSSLRAARVTRFTKQSINHHQNGSIYLQIVPYDITDYFDQRIPPPKVFTHSSRHQMSASEDIVSSPTL
jgi:hypothetical protein